MKTSLFALTALLAAPTLAQTAPSPAPVTAAESESIERASALGGTIYAFDRAAWVATDAMTAKIARDRLSGPGGWVVEPAPDRTLRVTFYRGALADAQVMFEATVRGGKVTDSRVVTTPTPLSAAQQRLVAARATAAAEAVRRAYTPCTAAPFNTVVLPSARPDGPVAVYLLSAQTEAGSYPLGGHYRITVGADGKVLSARPFSVACLNMAVPKLPAGAQPVGLFVKHLLDPTPTEIHVFTSYTARMPLVVGTRDRVWSVTGSRIAPTTMHAPPPPSGAPKDQRAS